MYYLCTSEEERARKHWILSSFFCKNRAKNGLFYKACRKIYMPKKNFYLLYRIFFGPSWCAN